MHGDWFVIPRHDPAFPAGAMSFWKTRQGGGNVGENIATTDGTITALGGANVRHKEVTTETRKKLAVVVGLLTTATETGTHAFFLHSLLGGGCLAVEAILPLVDWIDRNRTELVRIMAEQDTTAQFAYNVS